MATKNYIDISVLEASKQRISKIFDSFEKYYISFSGGKDSTVMTHLVMEEAIRRGKKVGLLIIDLEAQYKHTIEHVQEIADQYKDNIDLHWFCGELQLRNETYRNGNTIGIDTAHSWNDHTSFEEKKQDAIRQITELIKDYKEKLYKTDDYINNLQGREK